MIKTTISEFINSFSDTTKKRVLSLFTTFLTTFILSIATALTVAGQVELSSAFWIGLVITGAREAVKAVINTFVPTTLGGRKEV